MYLDNYMPFYIYKYSTMLYYIYYMICKNHELSNVYKHIYQPVDNHTKTLNSSIHFRFQSVLIFTGVIEFINAIQ